MDASDLVSQAVLRKVVLFKKCRKDMVLMKFKLPVEADVLKKGNQFWFRHMSTWIVFKSEILRYCLKKPGVEIIKRRQKTEFEACSSLFHLLSSTPLCRN